MKLRVSRICRLALLAVAASSGCGGRDYETIPTHPVTGRVTVNGVPAKGSIIRFTPKTPQPGAKYPLTPSGKANEEGGLPTHDLRGAGWGANG